MDRNRPVFPCPHCGSRHTTLSLKAIQENTKAVFIETLGNLSFLPEWLRRLLPVSGTCPAQGRIILACKDCGKRFVMYIM